ncbi:Ascorbate-specific PTS system EIIC component, partial [Mycoplasma putrefaciens]
MLVIYLIIYFTTLGVKGYQAMITAGVIKKDDDVFVQGLLQAFTFAAGVEIILIGVRMFIAEIIPSFQGISKKLVPDAKPALDCPTVYPYAPNAVIIGFISSFVAGIIVMGITILITSINGVDSKRW